MAHAKLETTSLVNQISRTSQFELVFLLIQQKQTVHLRYRLSQNRSQFRRRLWKSFERHVQSNLLVRRVRKRFDLQNPLGQSPDLAISCNFPNVFASRGESTGHSSIGTMNELSGKKYPSARGIPLRTAHCARFL